MNSINGIIYLAGLCTCVWIVGLAFQHWKDERDGARFARELEKEKRLEEFYKGGISLTNMHDDEDRV